MSFELSAAGVLGLALVAAAAIGVVGRVRVERERTLQRLIERGLAPDELAGIMGPVARHRLDLRRGAQLVSVGLAWTSVTYAIGGKAWLLGAVPVALGAAYLLVWGIDGRRR